MLAAEIAEHDRPIIDADAHADLRRAGRTPFVVPAVEGGQHRSGGLQRIAGVAVRGVRHAEGRQHRVADEFLERAAASEHLPGHPAVKNPQRLHHRFGRHRLGERGEADDIGEQHRDVLAAHRSQRLVLPGEQLDDVGREIARQVVAHALRLVALAANFAQARDLVERLADRQLEVGEVDRLGDEVERAAVHRDSDVGHVAVGRNDHRAQVGRKPGEQRQSVHHGHVDVGEHELDPGIGRYQAQRLGAVARKLKFVFAGPDLAAKALADQLFEIRLVVDSENLGSGHQQARDSWRSCCLRRSKSSGLARNSQAPHSAARRRRSSSP